MRNMKTKFLSLVMALAMGLCLAACGGGSGGSGLAGSTWVLSGGSQEGVTVNQDALESVLGGSMTCTFEEDGTVVVELAGVSVEGTWTQDGNTVELDIQGEIDTMTLDGDTLSMEESGVLMEFTRQ